MERVAFCFTYYKIIYDNVGERIESDYLYKILPYLKKKKQKVLITLFVSCIQGNGPIAKDKIVCNCSNNEKKW